MLSKKLNRIRLHHFMSRFLSGKRMESNDGPSNVTSAISSEYGDELQVKDYSRRLPLSFSNNSGRSLEAKLHRAKQKLRALTLLRLMYRDIVLYGTSSGILDHTSCYKPRLPSLILSHQLGYPVEIARSSSCWIPFSPESPYKKAWNVLVLTLLVITIVYVPVEISFFKGFVSLEVDVAMSIIDYIFLADVLLTFNTAYLDLSGLVFDRRAIALNYIRGTFFIDVISSMPLDLFSLGVKSQALLRYIRVFRLVKIFRAARFHHIIGYLIKANAQSQQRVATALSRILGALVLLLLLTHLTACMWYLSATYFEESDRNWVIYFGYQDLSLGELYMISLYWSITVLATIGYGDIYAISLYEKVVACLWMITGAMFFSFFLSTMSSVITGLDLKGVRIRDKLDLLRIYCKDLHLSKSFQTAMSSQLQRNMKHCTLDQSQKLDLVMQLPRRLRMEVATELYHGAVMRVGFFAKQDPIFLGNIVSMLEFRLYMRRETVYKRGTFADEIYFMGHGRVSFIIGTKGIPFRTMISGSFFGETEVMEEKPREYTAVAVEETEVFVVTRRVRDMIDFDGGNGRVPPRVHPANKAIQEAERALSPQFHPIQLHNRSA